jgi:hypothetical protein
MLALWIAGYFVAAFAASVVIGKAIHRMSGEP